MPVQDFRTDSRMIGGSTPGLSRADFLSGLRNMTVHTITPPAPNSVKMRTTNHFSTQGQIGIHARAAKTTLQNNVVCRV